MQRCSHPLSKACQVPGMKRWQWTSAFLTMLLLAPPSAILKAQVAFTGTYAQNFDALGVTGTTILPGWSQHGNLPGDNDTWSTFIPAGGAISAATAGTVYNTLVVSTGSSELGPNQGYNYGATGSTNRALGTAPHNTAGNILQLRLLNATGAAVTTLSVQYRVRRFRVATNPNELPGYWLFVSSNNGASWTEVTALRPSIATVPNTIGSSMFGPVLVNLPGAVANGAEIRFRWVDDNSDNSSPDQTIGLDDLIISLPTPLPVDLLRFDALAQGQAVRLEWTTGSEMNNDRFILLRSPDGAEFESIAVIPGGGTTGESRDYIAYDHEPRAGLNLYKIRQVDTDGTWSDGPLRAVVVENLRSTIYPNPVRGTAYIVGLPDGVVDLRLEDATGRLVASARKSSDSDRFEWPLGALPAGSYFVTCTGPQGAITLRLLAD